MRWRWWILVLWSAVPVSLPSQTQPRPLITAPLDESRLITLPGSASRVPPGAVDQGTVADDFAVGRVLLLVNRPADRETALNQFLLDAHTPGSATYHHWLTPQEFGEQFGPADADIQSASRWLGSHGLQVARISKGKQFIEFSGTAAQLRDAFHTEIHRYDANGTTRYANASAIRIPEALAPLVRGISPLESSRAHPLLEVAGRGTYSPSTKKATADWTITNPFGTANPNAYLITPADFATQYDLTPLYQAGVNGAGQTIAIINESNIDLSLVQAYQKLFGVAGTAPQVVIDGEDPGRLNGVDVEAYLDVEVSGAVAPKATVDLYIASSGVLFDPLGMAALRAVEDNTASVLSVSFGQCEFALRNSGNQFWAFLWEQAAAQGQTVLVASGDSGSECMPEQVNTVSGLASTPWNVAVGGTDFYYSDYATGGASAAGLWSNTNNANLGSLLAPIPEQPWDDPYGFDILANLVERYVWGAGGGGASNCTVEDSKTGACTSGYAKPNWQKGPGVPSDGARDLPDVSLFASNGANLSAWAICAYEGECAATAGSDVNVLLVGGTSASAPAMAGIMALVNQKYGRQGQANFTLYPLAQQKPAAFHDITVGNNSEVCGAVANPPICVTQWNGILGTTQYQAGPGYDQASGLGSVDANVLVTNWKSLSFQSTATTLKLSSTSVTHGSPITITAGVTASSGSGTPTGEVAVLTNSPLPASQAQTFIPLTDGTGSTSANYLPGGDYEITGHYGGDGAFAASTSAPVSVTIKPEPSNLNFQMTSRGQAIAASGSVAYNQQFQLNIQPTGVSAAAGKTNGNATGSATFTIDSTSATVALNGVGAASFVPPALPPGTHTASASYSGDASFQAASSTPVTFTVTKGTPVLNIYADEPLSGSDIGYGVNPGGSFTLTAQVGPDMGLLLGVPPPFGTATPTGTVTICLNANLNTGNQSCTNPAYAQTVALTAPGGIYSQYPYATVTLRNLAAGTYMPQLLYNGDANWDVSGLDYIRYVVVQPITPLASSATMLSISPNTISGSQTALLTTTVKGSLSAAPTGVVDFYDNGLFIAWDFLQPATSGGTSSAQFTVSSADFWNSGANQITAIYDGDSNYAPSTSSAVSITTSQSSISDFTLATQSEGIVLKGGSSADLRVVLNSVNSFNGAVALTCAPSSSKFSCTVKPTTVTLNGPATAAVSINATQPASPANVATRLRGWPTAGLLALSMIWIGGRTRRKLGRCILSSAGLLALITMAGCGGGSGTTSNPPPPPNATPSGTYSVVITGTANGIIHNAVVTVVVQ